MLKGLCMKLFLYIAYSLLTLLATPQYFAKESVAKETFNARFEYEMEIKEARKLEANVAKLKLGDSIDTVRSILGKPDYERILHTKQLLGGGRIVAKKLTYVIKRVHMDSDNV